MRLKLLGPFKNLDAFKTLAAFKSSVTDDSVFAAGKQRRRVGMPGVRMRRAADERGREGLVPAVQPAL